MLTTTQFLFLAYLWIVGVGFVYRSLWFWRQTGRSPWVMPRDDSAQGWIGRQMSLWMGLSGLHLGVALVWGPAPAWDWGILHTGARVLGVALLVLACGLMPLAQHHMGLSWRIGVPTAEDRTELVTSGVFAHSRNPVFLALRCALAGCLLLLPSALTLSAFWVGEVLLAVQVRLEEAHLHATLGPRYEAYCARTRRWL